jgi:hypothetical protein
MTENTVCPMCLLASYHPKDIEHKFCSACGIYYEGHEMRIEDKSADEDCAKDFAPQPPCGCPRVHYHVNRCCLEIHGEADGTVHCFLSWGDGEQETTLTGYTDWWQARQMALEWATPLVTGPER